MTGLALALGELPPPDDPLDGGVLVCLGWVDREADPPELPETVTVYERHAGQWGPARQLTWQQWLSQGAVEPPAQAQTEPRQPPPV